MNEELDEWEQYEEDGLLDLEVGQSVGPCISSPHVRRAHSMNDEIARQFGFSNAAEFHYMVANADISTPERLAAFKRWQEDDGSKDGLARLKTLGLASPQGGSDAPHG
jgi:hypothetical protein